MANPYEIIWTLKSQEDLFQIYNYFLETVNEDKAFAIVSSIVERVSNLSNMPLLGQKEPLLAKLKRDYRRLIEGNYKIIYNFRNDTVYINRIFDARQNPKKLKTK